MAPPSKDKGKAPARGSGSNDRRRQALQRALVRHYEKKKRRAGPHRTLDDTDPLRLDDLQPINDDEPSTDNEEDTGEGPVPGSQNRSEDTWAAMIRANEAMSKELAHLRAMNERNDQLTNGATPGASGSRARGSAADLANGQAAHAAPVAGGQPALNNPPIRPHLRAQSPPPEPEGRGPRRFVPLPKSKTRVTIEDIQEHAGLGNNNPRWLEISNIIRDLMTRVGMDYSNSWLRQDKSQMGILYSLILKEAPELGVFQNGWATEWLVQSKFNNHRYYIGKNRRQRCTNNEQSHRPPPPPELTPPQLSPQPSPPSCPASRSGSLEPAPPHRSPPPSRQGPPPPPPLEPTSSRPSGPPLFSDSAPRPSAPPSHHHPQRDSPPPPQPLPPSSHQPQQAPPHPELTLHRPSRPPSHSDSAPRPPPDPSTSSRRGGSRALRPSLSNSRRASLRSSRDGGAAADPTMLHPVNADPGMPDSRYNLRTRATAAAAAEAQTTTAVKEANQKRKAAGRTPQRGKKQPRKSESPLRLLEESDDGARSTDEDA